jgi:hypothetical protein
MKWVIVLPHLPRRGEDSARRESASLYLLLYRSLRPVRRPPSGIGGRDLPDNHEGAGARRYQITHAAHQPQCDIADIDLAVRTKVT